MFFLLNCGKGYTDVGVKEMTHNELMWHVTRLKGSLEKEAAAQEAAMTEMKNKMARRQAHAKATARHR
jgi:hypothetical protein